jgi:PDZ domain-containing protein
MAHRYSWFRYTIAGILIAYLLFFMPLPYVVIQPGTAEDVGNMVHVENGYDEKEGSFMLTTIRMWYYPNTNLLSVLYGYLHPYAHVSPREDVFGDESEQEYARRQEYVMLTSQSNAIQAAYKAAGIPYELRSNGVLVLSTVEGMPAAETLRPGDKLLKLNDTELQTRDDVFQFMENRSIGEEVKVVFERDGETHEAVIALGELDDGDGAPPRPGLGILPVDTQSVEPLDGKYKVQVSAGDIGGPSAGLMFALEIYNRLVDEDITRGYNIAGTGTITPEGEVGVIGGVDYKVVAAHRKGADIFFTPRDFEPDPDSGLTPVRNASLAIEQAEKLGTSMKIVPVSSLQEALDYLATLPPLNRNGGS